MFLPSLCTFVSWCLSGDLFLLAILQRTYNCFSEIERRRLTAEIASQELSFRQHLLERGLNSKGPFALVQMFEHQHGAQQQRGRICDAPPRDIRRRAVNCFEHGDLFSNVSAGRNTQTAYKSRTQVRDNISGKASATSRKQRRKRPSDNFMMFAL